MKNKLKQFCVGVKDINIKSHTYYLFNDVVNVKDFDPHNIKIDEKSYKKNFIYDIGHVAIKKDLKTYSVIVFWFMDCCVTQKDAKPKF